MNLPRTQYIYHDWSFMWPHSFSRVGTLIPKPHIDPLTINPLPASGLLLRLNRAGMFSRSLRQSRNWTQRR